MSMMSQSFSLSAAFSKQKKDEEDLLKQTL
jgi:hypothetical protein